LLGCAQVIADLADFRTVRAVAAATQVSPAMKVFTSHEGYETFSPRFTIHYIGAAGEPVAVELTPQRYAALAGPYNRRNAYGAALAYAPVLLASDDTRGLVDSVLRYAFCDPGTLVSELGLTDFDRRAPIAVQISPRHVPNPERQLRVEAKCDG
jgi:hypothetical protein